jgi:hypothetical protein
MLGRRYRMHCAIRRARRLGDLDSGFNCGCNLGNDNVVRRAAGAGAGAAMSGVAGQIVRRHRRGMAAMTGNPVMERTQMQLRWLA